MGRDRHGLHHRGSDEEGVVMVIAHLDAILRYEHLR
jgi:hypothetical protein